MKFKLDQLIHYMRNNMPHSAPVLARMKVENLHEDWVCTKEQAKLFAPFGASMIAYGTCHGIVREDEAYASKEEMATAICES